MLIEACVTSLASALAAERAGAGRLELCAALHDGGLTPSAALIEAVCGAVRIPVFVLVRVRGGGFDYAPEELNVMLRDIELARNFGAAGIVTGVLTAAARVDIDRTRQLVDAANGLPATFHRALDLTPNLAEALEAIVRAGATRVLTSGGAQRAFDGIDAIADLVRRAEGRIEVMAGGGIREDTVREIVERTGVREVHVNVARTHGAGVPQPALRLRKPLPADESAWEEIDEERLRVLVDSVQ